MMAADDGNGADLLTLEGVSKNFDGIEAVVEVSFAVTKGASAALIGPGSSGKTTLLDLISGVLKPDQGALSFDGRDLAGLGPHQIAALGISRCFNPPRPFEALSLEDNVIIGALLHKADTTTARRLALSLIDRLGLTPCRHLPAARLAMPQRKRLELARALATRPRLLLLDEMLAGTTPEEWAGLTEILASFAGHDGITLLLAERDRDTVGTLAERLITLDQGTLEYQTPEDGHGATGEPQA